MKGKGLSGQENIRCEYCGFIYDSPEPFVRKRRFFIAPAKYYCKSCESFAIDNALIKYLLFRLLWIGYALFAYHVQGYPQLAWLIVNLVLMGFLGFFVVLIHEAGHALTALALKIRLLGIEVGQGQKLLSFKVFDYPLTINKLPFLGGFTYVVFKDKEESVWKMSLVYLAGPLTNLVIFLGLLVFVGMEELLRPIAYGFQGIEIFTILAFDNIVTFFRNIIPRSFIVNGIKYDNDGKFLIKSIFKRREVYEALRVKTLYQNGFEAYNEKLFDTAEKWFGKGTEEYPDSLFFKYWRVASMYGNKNYQSALKSLENIIGEGFENVNNDEKYYIAHTYNLYAWVTYIQDDASKYDVALKYTKKAFDMSDNDPAILDTRGSIDIQFNNLESGEKLLWQSIKLSPLLPSKTSSLCSLAMAEIKSGNIARARDIYNLIIKMDQAPELLPRLKSRLEFNGGRL